MATMMKVPLAAFANASVIRAVEYEFEQMDKLNEWLAKELATLNTPSK